MRILKYVVLWTWIFHLNYVFAFPFIFLCAGFATYFENKRQTVYNESNFFTIVVEFYINHKIYLMTTHCRIPKYDFIAVNLTCFYYFIDFFFILLYVFGSFVLPFQKKKNRNREIIWRNCIEGSKTNFVSYSNEIEIRIFFFF